MVLSEAVPKKRNLYKILGNTIRSERQKAGLTQEQLAEKADLARNYIGNVERAENKVTLDTLARIATALKLTIHDITRGL